MKNGVMLLLSGAIGTLILAVVMTICGNMNHSVELQENLSTAMEGSVMEMSGGDADWSEMEMLTECIESMVFAVDSDMALMVEVRQADARKGILSMCTTGKYKHPNGMDGETKWERTVIYEKGEEAEKMEVCKVSFYGSKEDLMSEEACYKSYSVMEGECIMAPVEPRKAGLVFAGWKDSNDYMADFSQPVCQNLCYYAAWE